jgi:hypothetical protein
MTTTTSNSRLSLAFSWGDFRVFSLGLGFVSLDAVRERFGDFIIRDVSLTCDTTPLVHTDRLNYDSK